MWNSLDDVIANSLAGFKGPLDKFGEKSLPRLIGLEDSAISQVGKMSLHL